MKTTSFFLVCFTCFLSFLDSAGQCSQLWALEEISSRFGTGNIISFDKEGNVNSIFEIPAANEGAFPRGKLIQADNNKLYGMTRQAGEKDLGVIFEWDPETGIYTKKYDFDSYSGKYPYGSFIKATDGDLYGMTSEGGDFGQGNIFKWDPESNVLTNLLNFDAIENGAKPYGDLLQATNGKLYGMTSMGGTYNKGILFEFDLSTRAFQIVHHFKGADGSNPHGSLMQAADGKLYGMTRYGGDYWGVLFSYDIAIDTFIVEHKFKLRETGAFPKGTLYQASNGKLYGLTNGGGIHSWESGHGGGGSCGVLFEWDPGLKTFNKIYDFELTAKNPTGTLIESTGKLYGGLESSGSNKIFSYDLRSRKLEYFENAGKAIDAVSSLFKAGNGKLYGLSLGDDYSYYGYECGNLFECDTTARKIINKVTFNEKVNGGNPQALVNFGNGKMYGTTQIGGQSGQGTLFEWDTQTGRLRRFIKKLDFSDSIPSGVLFKTANQKILIINKVLSEWDPVTNKYTFIISIDSLGQPRILGEEKGLVYLVFKSGIYSYDTGNRTLLKRFTPSVDQPLGYMTFCNGIAYGITAKSSGNIIFSWNPSTGQYNKIGDLALDLSYPAFRLILTPEHIIYGPNNIQIDPANNTWGFNPGIPNSLLNLTQGIDGKFYGIYNSRFQRWDPDQNNSFYKYNLEYYSLSLVESYITPADTLKLEVCNPYDVPGTDYVYSRKGVYTVCKKSESGQDTLITFDLKFSGNSTYNSVDAYTCGDYISPSGKYRWSKEGKYMDTLTNKCGCDSVITVYLRSGNQYRHFEISACDYYQSPSGKYLWTESGVYNDTLKNVQGCDSILNFTLKINKTSRTEIDTAVCNLYISPGGKQLTQSGTYYDTVSNNNGCYNLVTINLKVNYPTQNDITLPGCDSVISPSGKYVWKLTGDYSDTIPNSCQCDSILSVHAKVIHMNTAVVNYGNALSAAVSGRQYNWLRYENGLYYSISGATHQSYAPVESGNYAVIITESVCSDTSEIIPVLITEIPDSPADEFMFYPNPTDGKVTIDLGKAYSEFTLTVINSTGSVVQELKIRNSQKGEFVLNEPGMYLVKVRTGGGERIQRVIKQ